MTGEQRAAEDVVGRHGETRASLSRMRADLEPLTAPDVAEAIAFSVAAPPNVNVAEMVVVPVRQG
ncbi:hypothetical protein [Streptomyces canus]|uniref:hypothetical protein n=1 Tax=Streptomyces canus TaxID=58343 RepID=UPI0030E5ED8E